jgi:hypothetical protein
LFQIAFDAVAAVADTHHFNKDNRATIVHHDIKPNQWIYVSTVLSSFSILLLTDTLVVRHAHSWMECTN